MKLSKVLVVAAVAMLACMASELPRAAALPPPSVRTFTFPGKNLVGSLLVLDYSSLSPDTVVDSEADCENACKTILGCNAYVFCDSPTGCGNTCASYTSLHPKLALPVGTTNYRTQALPITAFGGFQSGTGCIGTQWKSGLCSLKHVVDTSSPSFSTEVDAGWKSGVINITSPWTCEGMPFGLCDQCNRLWRYDGPHPSHDPCLKCGASITAALPGGAPHNLEQATRPWACNWCLMEDPTNTDRDRSECLKCVPKHAGKGLHNLCLYD